MIGLRKRVVSSGLLRLVHLLLARAALPLGRCMRIAANLLFDSVVNVPFVAELFEPLAAPHGHTAQKDHPRQTSHVGVAQLAADGRSSQHAQIVEQELELVVEREAVDVGAREDAECLGGQRLANSGRLLLDAQ